MKQNLIEKIERIQDPQVLEEIDKWVSTIVEASPPKLYSEKELNAVKEAYQQYQAGDTFSLEEANLILNKWLKEK